MDPKIKQEKRIRRHKRVRSKIFGTKEIPRLCVFRSNKHIFAQLIDDQVGKTLVAASDLEINSKVKSSAFVKTSADKQKSKIQVKDKKANESEKSLAGKVAIAYKVGQLIAQKAAEKKIKKVVFDRGGYRYHGRVKALAEGAREEGSQF